MKTPLQAFWALAAVLLLITACGGTAGQSRSDSSRSGLPGEGSPQPQDETGNGAGGGGSAGTGDSSVPCASSQDCTAGHVCTTEDGVCDPPPGCTAGAACPTVCYGACRPGGERCGSTICEPGMVCCNASCGTCTPPDGACTQQACETTPASACETDSDCRVFSDYCAGCDCRALSVCEAEPCSSSGVQCLVDPCGGKEAYCAAGACTVRSAPE